MEIKNQDVSNRISQVMAENGLDQKKLSVELEIAQPTISAILGLKRSPLSLIRKLSEKFGIEETWLLYGIGNKYKNAEEREKDILSESLSTSDKVMLLQKLNGLYERHQAIMSEAQDIMKTIIDINKKLILSGVDVTDL